MHFFGHKKTYKVEIQLLVGYLERRGRDWLLHSRWSLRLTPFPSARRRGPCKPTAQKAASRVFCFLYLCLQVNLRQRYKKQKVSISRYLFASWSCGEGGIPAQFVQDSYLLYMCLILQIIRSTMGYRGKLSVFSPSQSSHTILSVSHRCNFLGIKKPTRLKINFL